jgi:hypothetical protein
MLTVLMVALVPSVYAFAAGCSVEEIVESIAGAKVITPVTTVVAARLIMSLELLELLTQFLSTLAKIATRDTMVALVP